MGNHSAVRGWKRGEVAESTGCNIETVRFYEKIGLLLAPRRTESGHRIYDEQAVSRLAFILRARELGFSIEELRGLLDLVDGADYTCGEVRDLTLKHIEVIRHKIADLRKLERTMNQMVAKCADGTVPECPIVTALSEPRKASRSHRA
ncbi:helix-turn-helix domain-containing protein [Dongia sp.]|jgi:MerR family mercuric resistance operon transcriptional regulator|uniref:MerR family transcriptional regulator n=1 Tax=Dongia sp. TaxID=1977262 RepID=UPI0035AF44DB